MQIIRNINNLPQHLRNSVLAIGNFDGLHLAHQSLLNAAMQLANAQNKPKIVMSFHPHPRNYFVKNTANFAIESFALRLKRIQQLGFDCVVINRFNDDLANMSAHDFITTILQRNLGVAHVVVGDDFRFGKNRIGTPKMLRDYGIGCTSFAPIKLGNEVISSTNIRKNLTNGNTAQVAKLLGRSYEIVGMVVHGEKRGRELGFRTLNIKLNGLHLPAFGVYAVQLLVGGVVHQAIANIGERPTFSSLGENNQPNLEVHILAPQPLATTDLYGCKIRVQLLHHVRDEVKFADANALQNQIIHDIEMVNKYFEEHKK